MIVAEQDVADSLQAMVDRTVKVNKPLYGIFVKGTQLYVSNKRVYKSEGIAKGKLIDATIGNIRIPGGYYSRYKEIREEVRAHINQLIKDGFIEIKTMS